MTASSTCATCGADLPWRGSSCPWCSGILQNAPLHAGPPPASAPGSLLAGRYRLLEKIGEGGFGLVYKARDERQGGRLVAIKQITLAALSAQEMIEATDSYNREITILSKLQHRSLPRIYGHFTDPEHWYVVMQYIKGKTLEETLASVPQGRLPAHKVVKIGIALYDVLSYLHTQPPPIIYRDVKPANIMMTPRQDLYLIDFGIARRYREGQSKDTRSLGSPGYAAPEQYGKAQTTPATDIYGLGATLQTLLTGKEPLEIRVSGLPPDCHIPPELQALITQMLEPDLDKRSQCMHQIRQKLRDIRNRHKTQKRAALTTLVFLLALLFGAIYFSSSLWVICFLLALCTVVSISICYFYREKRSATSKLTLKEAYALTEKSMAHLSTYLQVLFWFLYSLSQFLRTGIFALLLVSLIIAVVCLVAGLMVVARHLPSLLKWLKRVRAARQQPTQPAQPAQTPPLQEQMRRHP